MQRYRLVRQLAVGGMAELFLARAATGEHAGRLVVVKRVHERLVDAEEFVELFADEARLAAELDHPNIVRVLDTGSDGGLPFLVMEWLDGMDLRSLLALTRLDRATALGIAGAVARGLAYAHELHDAAGAPLEIVHRDVSPHNVLCTREGAVKILDFGIAKARTRLVRTRTGLARGKVGYASPEQLAGLGVDARSDIFSLGVVLWEMLTGRVLWDRESDTATARAIRDESVTLPSLDDPTLPPRVDAIVVGMLSKFPVGRPARARDLADQLDETARSLGTVDLGARVAEALAPHLGPPIV